VGVEHNTAPLDSSSWNHKQTAEQQNLSVTSQGSLDLSQGIKPASEPGIRIVVLLDFIFQPVLRYAVFRTTTGPYCLMSTKCISGYPYSLI
jgi:hypothetical protein